MFQVPNTVGHNICHTYASFFLFTWPPFITSLLLCIYKLSINKVGTEQSNQWLLSQNADDVNCRPANFPLCSPSQCHLVFSRSAGQALLGKSSWCSQYASIGGSSPQMHLNEQKFLLSKRYSTNTFWQTCYVSHDPQKPTSSSGLMSLNGNSPSFHGIQLLRLSCVPRTIFSGYSDTAGGACWQ